MTELILCEYLPVEILLIIWEDYMTDRDKLFVTKENYEKNHKHIFDYYPKLRTKQGFFKVESSEFYKQNVEPGL